ncbi:MAG: hypothetical protein WCK14_04480 [Actinomycetota bacterium]|jgi:hypothetical protein
MSEQFDTLADRLDAISEELAEVALAELSQAIRGGASKRPAAERAVTQARRAVEKAAHLLRSIDADNDLSGSHELD